MKTEARSHYKPGTAAAATTKSIPPNVRGGVESHSSQQVYRGLFLFCKTIYTLIIQSIFTYKGTFMSLIVYGL